MENRRISVKVQFFQGLGSAPDTIKNWAFNNLVLFYFERIWGVPGALCGLALMGSSYYFRVWYGPLDARSHVDSAVVNFVRPGLDLDVESIEIDVNMRVNVVFTIVDDRGLPLDRNGVLTPL